MANYQIVADQKQVQEFINWLPDLGPSEKFYCTLLARKKYWPHIKADKGQLKRFTATKANLLEKLGHLECEVGRYVFEGVKIPNEALAVYITPNPRCLLKATKTAVRRLLDLALSDARGYNPHQEVMSEIQKAKSKTHWLDFDFDLPVDWQRLPLFVNLEAVTVVKTRGGHHILVAPDKVKPEFKSHFYQKLTDLGADVTGDCLLPIPGTYQGGVVVSMLDTPST